MRVLAFCPYYPPHVGGLESHAAEFNNHLKSRVEAITVFTPRLPESAPARETNGNVTVIRFPAIELISNFPVPRLWVADYWRLRRQLATLKPDIILSRTRFFWTSVMALGFAKRHHLPWFHIEHGSDFVQLNSRWKSAVARLFDETLGRLVLRSSSQNIAISAAAAAFIKKFDSRPTPVIHRGVEVSELLAVRPLTTAVKAYRGQTVIGFVGRLIDGKGVLDLLSALPKLKDKNWVCFIIGDGPQRALLEKEAARLKITKKVIFWGNQPRLKAMALLKTAAISVNPSYTEGLPTSVIEAALAGCAVIATDVGGTNEIITHNQDGLLISPRRPDQIVATVNTLMSDPSLRDRLARNAQTRCTAHFSWDRSIEQYLEVFRGDR